MMSNQQLGAGILANDGDPDGDPLTVSLEHDVTQGTLSLGIEGFFTYQPDEGFTGTDSFTYFANDGQADSNPATVTISVGPVNRAPQAQNDSYVTERNEPLVVAAELGVPKSKITLKKGQSSRLKTLEVPEGTRLPGGD